MKELRLIAESLRAARVGDAAALATVVAVSGSAYRRPGARMLMTREGRSSGIVSSGCVDYDVFEHARRVMTTGEAVLLRYDSSKPDDLVFGTGLGCKGVVDVLVERVTPELARDLANFAEAVQRRRQPGFAVVHLPGAAPAGHRSFHLGECAVQAEPEKVFVDRVDPPIHLVLMGGWFDILPLIRFGKELGWQITVIDVRQRPSSKETFREADAVLLGSPEEALAQIPIDARTAVVSMNHQFEHDGACLAALARRAVPYLGLLGPKRRRAALLERLAAEGGTAVPENVLHGPVGLDIGSRTPEEIALSIIAEVQSVFGRNGT